MYGLQTILFNKNSWTKTKAKKWLIKHNYHYGLDEKVNFLRYRQIDPSEFVRSSFRTKKLSNGIEMVFGKLK